MLQPDPELRASINDLLNDKWITADGAITKDIEPAEQSRGGFGNIHRLLTMQANGCGKTYSDLKNREVSRS